MTSPREDTPNQPPNNLIKLSHEEQVIPSQTSSCPQPAQSDTWGLWEVRLSQSLYPTLHMSSQPSHVGRARSPLQPVLPFLGVPQNLKNGDMGQAQAAPPRPRDRQLFSLHILPQEGASGAVPHQESHGSLDLEA